MKYYSVAIYASATGEFIYSSEEEYKSAQVVMVKLRSKLKKALIIGEVAKPDFKCVNISQSVGYLSSLQFELVKFISKYYICSLGQAWQLMFETNLKHEFKDFSFTSYPTLSASQLQAKQKLLQSNVSLLFGDTGSGKTEIYISLIADCLNEGKNAILLMPEISLTVQMQKRLEKYFSSFVATWHSKISPSKKEQILRNIASGDVKIIFGARSALFTPLENIGLIIVDEEHDSSYKSANTPCYNARDLAILMGKLSSCRVVLGSATPSETSYHKFSHVRLKGTFHESKKKYIYLSNLDHNAHPVLPYVEKFIQIGMDPAVIDLLQKDWKPDSQAIVFVPTRANFKYLTCRSCGYTQECPFCSVALSLHKDKKILKCHYCSYVSSISHTCDKCNCDMLEGKRAGTAEVAEAFKMAFENLNLDLKVETFDKDSITSVKKLNAILSDFKDKKIDILIGTQMLSKGHDYENVDFSILTGLDNMLYQADFQARERALSLAIQVAGRCGRKREGKVILLSRERDFFSTYIEDYERFLQDDLPFRKEFYPPFVRLLRLIIQDKNEINARNICEQLKDEICEKNLNLKVISSGISPILRLANMYRYEILIRSKDINALLQAGKIAKKRNVKIDMDPIHFE